MNFHSSSNVRHHPEHSEMSCQLSTLVIQCFGGGGSHWRKPTGTVTMASFLDSRSTSHQAPIAQGQGRDRVRLCLPTPCVLDSPGQPSRCLHLENQRGREKKTQDLCVAVALGAPLPLSLPSSIPWCCSREWCFDGYKLRLERKTPGVRAPWLPLAASFLTGNYKHPPLCVGNGRDN